MKEKTTIIMTTYNGAEYLDQQLDSILSQTLRPDEIIIADDGSTDETREILSDYASKYSFIKLIFNNKNLGINKNFEKTILSSDGDILFLSDQDDIWINTKIEKIMNEFNNKKQINFIYSDAKVIDENGETLCDSELAYHGVNAVEGEPLISLLYRNCISGHNIAFRKCSLDKAVPFPEKTLYDHWLALFFSTTGEIGFIDEKLAKHRIHRGNSHNNHEQKKLSKKRIIFPFKKFINMNKKRGKILERINRLIAITGNERHRAYLLIMQNFYRRYNFIIIGRKYRKKMTLNSNEALATLKTNKKRNRIMTHSRGGLFYFLMIF